MKINKKNKISLIILILFFFILIIVSFCSKAEAWGYMIKIADRGVWTDYGTETACKLKLAYDPNAVTSCEEKNPSSSYIFTEKIGPIGDKNKIIGNSYSTTALCETARQSYIKTTATPSPCYLYSVATYYVDPGVVNLTPEKPVTAPGSAVSTTYTFLAPIGDSLTIDTNDIGAYFNLIFKLAIGLCAALAVIMIIIGGVQYMGDESVFGKTEAKDRIIKAILGLLIAVGSWALLNTINPALTGVGGINVANVSVEVEDIPWSYYEPGDNKTGCPSGYRDVLTSASPAKINVCSSIASDLEKLIAAAKSSSPSIILSGSGSRSMATQQALRIKNKCPDIKTPANKCTPKQVAIPGNSNHEKGLAVDFNCNGKSMLPDKVNLNNVCYVWLSKNASKYGLSNDFKAIQETWHWSTTGR